MFNKHEEICYQLAELLQSSNVGTLSWLIEVRQHLAILKEIDPIQYNKHFSNIK